MEPGSNLFIQLIQHTERYKIKIKLWKNSLTKNLIDCQAVWSGWISASSWTMARNTCWAPASPSETKDHRKSLRWRRSWKRKKVTNKLVGTPKFTYQLLWMLCRTVLSRTTRVHTSPLCQCRLSIGADLTTKWGIPPRSNWNAIHATSFIPVINFTLRSPVRGQGERMRNVTGPGLSSVVYRKIRVKCHPHQPHGSLKSSKWQCKEQETKSDIHFNCLTIISFYFPGPADSHPLEFHHCPNMFAGVKK